MTGSYVQYDPEHCGATFDRRCIKCKRFVKANTAIKSNADGYIDEDEDNATCSQCGLTQMLFIGYY